MNEYNIVLESVALCCGFKAVIYGQLTCFATGHNFADFVQSVAILQLLHIINPISYAYTNNAVDFGMILENFDSMYDDRLTVNHKKLLWLSGGFHSCAYTACENNADIHKLYLLV